MLDTVGSAPNTGWLAGSGLSLTDGVDCDEYRRADVKIQVHGVPDPFTEVVVGLTY